MEKEYAEYLLKKTTDNYNLIAEDFSRTRAFIPEDIKKLGEYAIPGEKVLDSGCGSGRLFEVLKDQRVDYFGVDISEKLIEIAKKNYFGTDAKFQVADSLNLPFPANFFGAVYSISVLHHIPSREFQIQYLKEAKRVLRPEGILVLRVWDFWKRKQGWELILKYGLFKLTRKKHFDFGDIFLPWKSSEGKLLVERYFHCFTKKGLENLAKEAGFKIKKSWRAGKGKFSNIYLIAKSL
ncbi:class I SAM-dependent methyltransferase [Patescibacteria group bacterium]|nr:class I SAM-dependent methyltransferase [Patescibacteria group bacterium]MBU4481803.1 class I SAM-dependent methyltransferase [Patescibacteria group bacterium]